MRCLSTSEDHTLGEQLAGLLRPGTSSCSRVAGAGKSVIARGLPGVGAGPYPQPNLALMNVYPTGRFPCITLTCTGSRIEEMLEAGLDEFIGGSA